MKSGAGGSEKPGLKTKGRPPNGSWVLLHPNSLSSTLLAPISPFLPLTGQELERGCPLLGESGGAQPRACGETWSLTCIHRLGGAWCRLGLPGGVWGLWREATTQC